MDEHKKYLADRLLSEEQPITYRLLSRALDVHVNTAKEMLYDYHVYQNEQKPSSIHATYLVYGLKASEKQKGADGDVEMSMSSSMPDQEGDDEEEVPIYTLSLVREENLTESLKVYQEVLSIHVYSLAPHPQRDLSLLADITKSVAEYSIKEQDPTASAKKYGTIINPHVRRRTRKGTAPVAAAAKSQPAPAKPKAEPAAAKPKVEPKEKEENPGSVASKVKKEGGDSSKESTPAPSTKPTPALKRGASGGIMQSFAKAANMPKKPAKKDEDTAMALSDDGEADDDDIPAPKKVKEEDDSVRKSRKEREEELRRMMEEDEDDDEPEEEENDPADQEMEEAPEPEPEPEPKAEVKEEPAEVVSSTEGGRRRGRRKVMQKKRILDDQGYMVTIQELGWESFSEDEAPPPAKKAAAAVSKDTAAAKAKKPAGKPGQGNIMSFFSKK